MVTALRLEAKFQQNQSPKIPLFFIKFMTDSLGNIVMIIRQTVFISQPCSDYCVTFTWRVTCLFLSHTPMFFLLLVWMSLSWSLPLKLSSCFRLSHLHSLALPTRVAALHGLIQAGRGCLILKKMKQLGLIVNAMLAFFLFPWKWIFPGTLTVMGFLPRSQYVTDVLLSQLVTHTQACCLKPPLNPLHNLVSSF